MTEQNKSQPIVYQIYFTVPNGTIPIPEEAKKKGLGYSVTKMIGREKKPKQQVNLRTVY